MRTIAVLQQKGGVGKTTLATNLAAASHLEGHRTIILDFDKQSSASDWLRKRTEASKLKELDVRQADKPVSLEKIKLMTRGYDIVIIDGPARLGERTMAAAVAADLVLIPACPGPLDFWATDETLNSLDQADEIRLQLGLEPVLRLFVMNRVPSRAKIIEQFRAALAEQGKVADVTVSNLVIFPTAMLSGESVLTMEQSGRAGREILRLFDLVMGRERKPPIDAEGEEPMNEAHAAVRTENAGAAA